MFLRDCPVSGQSEETRPSASPAWRSRRSAATSLPVCVVIFNNDGIYRGTDVNSAGAGPGDDRLRQRRRATTR